MKASIDFLIFLSDLYKCTPYNTPNRLNLILSQATDAMHLLDNGYEIDIPGFENCTGDFEITIVFIAKFSEHASKLQLTKLPKHDIVVMPSKRFCCNELIKMPSRYATVK